MGRYKRNRSARRVYRRKRSQVYKRTRRVYKRRYNRSRRAKEARFRRISRIRGFGFGDSKVIHCRWVAVEGATVAQGAMVTLQSMTPILLNSAYDPWSGITGVHNTTAAGFDLHAQIYNRYMVLGAKLVVTFRPHLTSVENTDAIVSSYKVGIHKAPSSSVPMGTLAHWAQCATDPDTVTKTMVVHLSEKTQVSCVMTYSPRREWNAKDSRDLLVTTGGPNSVVTSNPTFTMYATAWFQNCDNDAVNHFNGDWNIEYKLYQKVLFYDRKDVNTLPDVASLVQDI